MTRLRSEFPLGCAIIFAVAFFICALAIAPRAHAFEDEGQPLMLSGPDEVSMGFLDVCELPLSVSPESAQLGVTCGMEGMCGQEPCLCGSSDAWGSCSCNGLKDVRPTLTMADMDGGDVAFAHIVEIFGRTWLVTCGAGRVDALVTAKLDHYADAQARLRITAAPFGVPDALKVVAAVALAVLLVCAIAFVARWAIRVAGLIRSRRARGQPR